MSRVGGAVSVDFPSHKLIGNSRKAKYVNEPVTGIYEAPLTC